MKKLLSTALVLSVLSTPAGAIVSHADVNPVCQEKTEPETTISQGLNIESDVNSTELKAEETANLDSTHKKSSFNEKMSAVADFVVNQFNKVKTAVKTASYKVVLLFKSISVKVKGEK